MRPKFIYVFDEESKRHLIDHGYTVLREDAGVYVFVNREDLTFSLPVKLYSLSDTLVF